MSVPRESRTSRRDPLAAGVAVLMVALAGCGGQAASTTTGAATVTVKVLSTTATSTPNGSDPATTTATPKRTPPVPPKPAAPPYPQLLGAAQQTRPTGFVPAVKWQGRTAAWVARSAAGIDLISFDQSLVGLHLHSGTVDAGSSGWRYGPAILPAEQRSLVAAMNGGFKFSTGAGGFMSYGNVGAPLRDGLGSIVTYTDGHTDIGSWHQEVPAPGQQVASVRQNQTLLIDRGQAASTVGCDSCWGATLGGVSDPARSALGVTADGRLIWAGGEHVTVAQLADALLGARVLRAVELDINPEWVAAYLYGHRGGVGPLAPVPVVPAQQGIPGQFLAPWSRDFFTLVAR